MEFECFKAISLDGLGPIEMKICSVCQYDSLCAECGKLKKNKKNEDTDNFTTKNMKKKGLGNEACPIKQVYVVIFVDMSSRFVVLELLQDRTTESFLLAFMRMTAAYGSVNTILSDNAPEYHRANKEIQAVMEMITSEETRKKLGERGVDWKFIPALSPKKNSVSEIMVREAKKSLYKTFNGRRFTQTELETALKLAQASLNSRPLIAVSDDVEDGNILTLTPSHLVLGRAIVTLPTSLDKLDINALNKIPVKTRWEQRRKAERRFFLRWQNEYLNVLKERTHNLAKTKPLQRGDICLLINERRNRLSWPLARVVETFPSRDGKVRSVLLRRAIHVSNKETKPHSTPKYIKRGVENLALLESAIEDKENSPLSDIEVERSAQIEETENSN